jgi:hypothetical protein
MTSSCRRTGFAKAKNTRSQPDTREIHVRKVLHVNYFRRIVTVAFGSRLAGIYRHLVTTGRRDDDVGVDNYVDAVGARLHKKFNMVCARIQVSVEDQVPELRGDGRMTELLAESIRANAATVLDALSQHSPEVDIVVPKAAFEHAKRIARQGIPVNTVVRAYRLAQRRMTELIFAELHGINMDPTTRVAVIERITAVLFECVDRASQQAVAAYEVERDRWLENKNSIRAMRVRDLLAEDKSVDVDGAPVAVDYPLDHQHLALIAWYPEVGAEGDELACLQRFVADLAAAVHTSADPLFVAADKSTGWAWLPHRSAPGDLIAKVRDFARLRPNSPRIAMGAVGSGVEGFRRSHGQAQRVRAAALAGGPEQRAITAATDADVAPSALLGTSIEEIGAWVTDVLGALASDNDDDARLREALWVFLHSGSRYEAGATELNLPFHAVKQRVEQAVARRRRPIDDRLDVEIALFACRWYGAAALLACSDKKPSAPR